MEEFKKSVKKRIAALSCMGIVAALVGVYNVFGYNKASDANDGTFLDGMASGMSFGIICALGILAIIQIIRLRKVINDDRQLKLLYNQEHDERMKVIRSKAGMPMLLIMSILMIIAGLIASNFSSVVFCTLIAAACVQLLCGVIIKIYCMKAM
jgi:hypothetical protein